MQTHSYHDLQILIDRIVGKIGLSGTIKLFERFIDEKNPEINHGDKIKIVVSYIIAQCLKVYNLNEEQFYSSSSSEYREGRMACYHLLKTYTGSTYERIAQLMSQKKRNVLYFSQKCNDILSIPQFHRSFVDKYTTLEGYTVEFIAKLNI